MREHSDNEVETASRRDGPTECKPLLAIATQNIFRRNSFRVTSLPVDATAREISKHIDKLKQMTELGIATGAHRGPLALDPPPTPDDIRDAYQNLKDPETRILDEFFWFWPEEFGHSQSDPAIQAVTAGDCDTALTIWKAKETSPTDGVVAMHNIAVFWHLKALDLETSSSFDPLTQDSLKQLATHWRDALKRWNYLATDDALWEKISGRIRQIAEARLTTRFVRRMRATLPLALRKVHGELALYYCQAGATDLAKMQVGFLRTEGDAAAADRAAELTLAPTTARVREHVRNAKQTAEASPKTADQPARDLIDLGLPLRTTFDLFYGEAPHPAKDILDEVASACVYCLVAHQHSTEDNRTFVELLERTLPLAESSEVRKRIQDNIQIGKKNQAHEKFYGNLTPISSAPSLSTINGIGFALYGSTDKDPATGSYLATYYFVFIAIPIFPICRYRVIPTGNGYRFFGKAPLRPFDKWHLAISVGLIIWFIVAINYTSNAPSTGSYAPPTAPQSTYTPVAAPSQPAPATQSPFGESVTPQPQFTPRTRTSAGQQTYRISPSLSAELDRDKQAINAEKTKAARIEALLEASKTEVEAKKAEVDELDSALDTLSRQIERDRIYLDRTSQFEIDSFNLKVNRYNAALRNRKAEVQVFNEMVETHNTIVQQLKTQNRLVNQMVDNYNTKLQQYRR